jgi:hypothetical protein
MVVTKQAKIKSKMVRGKDNRNEFADLCGVWTAEEAASFLESISELQTVESEGFPPQRRDLPNGRRT